MSTVNLGINHANLIFKNWTQYKRSEHDKHIINTAVDYYLDQLEHSSRKADIWFNRTTGDMCDHSTPDKDGLTIRAWQAVEAVPELKDVIEYFTRENL